jgi:hypothetical protein
MSAYQEVFQVVLGCACAGTVKAALMLYESLKFKPEKDARIVGKDEFDGCCVEVVVIDPRSGNALADDVWIFRDSIAHVLLLYADGKETRCRIERNDITDLTLGACGRHSPLHPSHFQEWL